MTNKPPGASSIIYGIYLLIKPVLLCLDVQYGLTKPEGRIQLQRKQLISHIHTFGKEYCVAFDLYLSSNMKKQIANVIYFQKNEHMASDDRIPSVFLKNSKFISIRITIGNKMYFYETEIPRKEWFNIRISQVLVSGKYHYRVHVKGSLVLTKVNAYPITFKNVNVFAANQRHGETFGSIRYLHINGEKLCCLFLFG